MSRNIIETLIGGFVLLVAILFLNYSFGKASIGAPDGYTVYADFSGLGGLKEGDDVRISGVKVGAVKSVTLVPETYLARVTLSVDKTLEIPNDSAAIIGSESLMGGRFLQIDIGAEEDMLEAGGRIEFTQAPQNLEQLLGKFIFSMNDNKNNAATPPPPPPAPSPVTPPKAEMPAVDVENVPAVAPNVSN